MAEMKRSSLVALKKECQNELEWQKRQAALCTRRRSRLTHLIRQEYSTLHRALKKFPLLSSPADKKNYGELKRSYDLFCVQIENALSTLKDPVHIELIPVPPKSQKKIAIGENYRDDLLDAQKDNTRIIDQYEKEGFLAVLQILDTAERLKGFSFPDKGARGKVYQRALEKLQKRTDQTGQTILKALNRRKIKEIPLLPGIYPSIEKTKIISRNDNQTNDEIVISRVNEKGYTWRTAILRKAAVEVITKA